MMALAIPVRGSSGFSRRMANVVSAALKENPGKPKIFFNNDATCKKGSLMLKVIFFASEPSPPGVSVAFGKGSRVALVAVSATGQQGSRRGGAMLHVFR